MPLVPLLQRLFDDGTAVLRERPRLEPGERREALALLERAYGTYRLDVGGPPVDFDAGTALAAAELLGRACWFLVNHAEPAAELEKSLALPAPPTSAAQHLSADLLLRFLPQVHRRARAVAPDDRLAALLACVLRQWPLSGVLSDVEEAPLTPPDFGGHPGLLLLYAERLARAGKPAWVPAGRGLEYLELVLAEQGKERSPLPAAARAANGSGTDGE
jgi:hypothetical protein